MPNESTSAEKVAKGERRRRSRSVSDVLDLLDEEVLFRFVPRLSSKRDLILLGLKWLDGGLKLLADEGGRPGRDDD